MVTSSWHRRFRKCFGHWLRLREGWTRPSFGRDQRIEDRDDKQRAHRHARDQNGPDAVAGFRARPGDQDEDIYGLGRKTNYASKALGCSCPGEVRLIIQPTPKRS